MSVNAALNTAVSGLRVTQRDLDVVAGNVANAGTDGYTRKVLVQSDITGDNRTIGVRAQQVSRVLDQQVQAQLRDLASVNTSNQISSDFLSRLDVAFGEPGSPTALDTGFNQALASLEALSTSPDDFSAQIQAVTDLRVFTGQLNSLSETIQNLRREADIGIADTVRQANLALQGIADVNQRIVSSTTSQSDPVFLLDERDRFIDELSQIVDIEVTNLPNNGVQIRTTSGITLFESQAFPLDFQQAGTVGAESTLANGALSTVRVTSGSSSFSVDLLANNGARQGALAAYSELRDTVLVQAQAQLDAFAAQLSIAISNVEVPSSAIAGGLAVDTAGALNGNTLSLGFTDSAGTARSVTFVQVSDPASLPVAQTYTADPNDVVIGVDFNAATAAADAQAALDALLPGNGITIANTGTSFEFSAAAPPAAVGSLSASITNPAFTNGLPFALFEDSATGGAFTNALGPGPGIEGFAGRIQVADQIITDPSLLSRFTAGNSSAGDSSRVNFVLQQIRGEVNTYSPSTGLGAPSNPIRATAADFLQTIISSQGQRAAAATRDADSSQVSFNNVQERIQEESGVNIDVEISRLVQLEQTYQANARVLTAVQDLIDALFAAIR